MSIFSDQNNHRSKIILVQEWVDLHQVLKLFNKLTVPVLSSLSGHLREFKNKGKVHLDNPKSSHSHLQELFSTKFKSVQTGFHKGGRN